MKKTTALLLIMLLANFTLKAQWSSFSSPGNIMLTNDVFITPQNDIYLVGKNNFGLPFEDDDRVIYKSSNGGVSYNLIYSEDQGQMNVVYFVDEQLGFVAGVDENFDDFLLKTIDGGSNWETILEGIEGGITSIDVFDNNHIYISYNGLTRSFLYSNDGGDSWIDQYESFEYFYNPFTSFLEINTGFTLEYHIGIDQIRIAKTTDNGITWSVVYQGDYDSNIIGFDMLSESYGYYATEDGTVYTTMDGGQSWTEGTNHYSSGYVYQDIKMKGNLGLMVSVDDVLYSSDGGLNWYLAYDASDLHLYECVDFNDNGLAVASGLVTYSRTNNLGGDISEESAFISGYSNLCAGEDGEITIDFTGSSPWAVSVTNGSNTNNYNNINQSPFTVDVNIQENQTYTISSFSANGSNSNQYGGSAFFEVGYFDNLILDTDNDTLCAGSNSFSVTFENGCPPYNFLIHTNEGVDTFMNITTDQYDFNYELNDEIDEVYVSSLFGNVISDTIDVLYYPNSTATLYGAYNSICYATPLSIPVQLDIINPPATIIISDGNNEYTLSNLTGDTVIFNYIPTENVLLQIVEAYDQCGEMYTSGYNQITVEEPLFAVEGFELNVNPDRSIDLSWIDNNDDDIFSIKYRVYKKEINDTAFVWVEDLLPNETNYTAFPSDYSGSYFIETFTFDCKKYSDTLSFEFARHFERIDLEWGLEFNGIWSISTNVFDFDNDLDDDLIVDDRYLFMNEGDFNFSSSLELLDGSGNSNRRDFTTFDFDNDGNIDLINDDGVYLNNTNEFVLDNTIYYGLSNYNFNHGTWFDIDNDGDIDQFDSDWFNDSLVFLQNGYTFQRTPFSSSPGSEGLELTGSILFFQHFLIDVNNDGHLDFFGEHDEQLMVLMNEGDGALGQLFTIELPNSPCEPEIRNCVIGDFNNDLYEDILISFETHDDVECNSLLLVNDQSGSFTTATTDFRSPHPYSYPTIGDLDNDGDLDAILMIASPDEFSSDSYRIVALNDGQGNFSTTFGLSFTSIIQHDMALSDFDGDGWLDAFTVSDITTGAMEFHRNTFQEIEDNFWIQFKLESLYSNKSAVGAKINVFTAINNTPTSQTRTLKNNGVLTDDLSSYIHFGVGDASNIDSVVVHWPSGVVNRLINVGTNQKITIVEGNTLPDLRPASNLRVTNSSATSIEIAWNYTSSFNTDYVVYRESSESTDYVILDTTNYTTYEDKSVIPSETYCYKIKALRFDQGSEFTNQLCNTTDSLIFILGLYDNTLHPITGERAILSVLESNIHSHLEIDTLYVELAESGQVYALHEKIPVTNGGPFSFNNIEDLNPLTDYCVRYYYFNNNRQYTSTTFCFTTKSECFIPVSFSPTHLFNDDINVFCDYDRFQTSLLFGQSGYTYTLLSNGFPLFEVIIGQNFVMEDEYGGHLQILVESESCTDTIDLRIVLLGENAPSILDVPYCDIEDIRIPIDAAPLSEIIIHTNNTYPHQTIPGFIIPEGISSDDVYYEIEIKENSPLIEECNQPNFSERHYLRRLQDEIGIGGDAYDCENWSSPNYKINISPFTGVNYDWQYKATDSISWTDLSFYGATLSHVNEFGHYRCIVTSQGDNECIDTTQAWEFSRPGLSYTIQGYVVDIDGDPIEDEVITARIADCSNNQGFDFYKNDRTDENGFFTMSLNDVPCINYYNIVFNIQNQSFQYLSVSPDDDIFDFIGPCSDNLYFQLPFNYEVTSTSENNLNNFSIWPNPASHYISVVFDSPNELPDEIKISNIQGKTLVSWDQSIINSSNVQLDLSNIKNEGIYLLHFIYTNDMIKSAISKIVILK